VSSSPNGVAIALSTALLLAAGGCGGGADPATIDRLVIAAGPPGDVDHALGTALADAAADRLSVRAEVRGSTGPVESLRLVADGRADVGFATVDATLLARQGDAPFASALPLVALAGLYDGYLQVVVPAGSDVRDLAGLRGRRVSIGVAGSAEEIIGERLLRAAGLDPRADVERDRLPAREAAEALASGSLDAFATIGGLPTPVISDLARRTPIRLIPVADEVPTMQAQFGEYYAARSVPAGMYGPAGEIATLGVRNVLVVRRDLPERQAEEITRLLFDARRGLTAAHAEARRLDTRSALASFPVPLHPGATRFYREAKPLAVG
jgi:hypothetical protein